MSTEVVPSLLSQLNPSHLISTRLLAELSGKEIFRIHSDVRRVFSKHIHKFDVERNQQDNVTAYWLPLGEALFLMSRYEGARAERAREFIIEAVDYYIHTQPRLEAELAHAQAAAELFSEHNSTLRQENQELASQVRARLPRPKKAKRFPVPVFYGDMFGQGIQVRKELRAEGECKPWQWKLGMMPMLGHLAGTLFERIRDIKAEAYETMMAKFSPEEMPVTRSEFEEAVRRVINDFERNEVQPH